MAPPGACAAVHSADHVDTIWDVSPHSGTEQRHADPHREESAMSHGQFSIEEAGSGAIPSSRLAAAAVFIAILFTVPPAAAQELSVWTNLTTAAQATVIQKQVTACAAKQTGVSVKFETVPFGAMYTRLITALRKNEMPNLMNTLEGAVAFVQAKNGLVSVTDLVQSL